MKKFTSIATALVLAGLGFNANAQLGTPTITPAEGNIPQWSLGSVTIDWGVDVKQVEGVTIEAEGVNADGQELTLGGYIYPSDNDHVAPATRADEEVWGTLIIECDGFGDGWTPGTYTVTVPAGIVEDENGNTNQELNLEWTVLGTRPYYEFTWTPETGDWYSDAATVKASDLTNVSVDFGGTISFTNNTFEDGSEYAVQVEKYITEYQTEAPFFIQKSALTLNSEGTGFSFDLSSYVESGYTYRVTIPAQFVVIEVDGESYFNGSADAFYFVWEGLAPGTIVEGPDSWYSYETLPIIKLEWDENVTATSNGITGYIYFGLYDISYYDPNSDIRYTIPTEAFNLSGNVLTIDAAPYFGDLKNGSYLIELAENSVESNGRYNPSQVIPSGGPFYIQNYSYWTQSNPNLAVGEDDTLELSWPGYWINRHEYDTVYFTVTDSKGVETQLELGNSYYGDPVYIAYNEDMTEDWVVIDLSGLDLTEGQYTLTVPEKVLLIQDEETYEEGLNQELELTFTYTKAGDIVSGISGINAEDGVYRVYNLQGVKVMEGKDLNGLSNGLYIINGKKVVVRK